MSCSTISIILLQVLALVLPLQRTTSFQPPVNSNNKFMKIKKQSTHINISSSAPCASNINNINNMSSDDNTTKDNKDDDNGDGAGIITFSSILFDKNNHEQQEQETEREETVLIILNYPIPELSPIFHHIWESSTIRIAADGGANRLYDYSKSKSRRSKSKSELESKEKEEEKELDLYIPNRIRGDLDSLKPNVREYYENLHPTHNVIIEKDPDQDTNDLDKALQVVCCNDDTNIDVPNVGIVNRRVIIYGAFGGRFDQEMASFAALYKWSSKFNHQLYLYSDETCAFLIPANIHCHIKLPYYDNNNNNNNFDNEEEENNSNNDNNNKIDFGEGPTCGLIPLGCRCESIITSGLKWDLDGTIPLEFGGLVSSSNHIMEPIVEIFSSHPIIFTAEICSKK
jgi:thiamine pyrophosphokinase